jgi:hypothetical protein
VALRGPGWPASFGQFRGDPRVRLRPAGPVRSRMAACGPLCGSVRPPMRPTRIACAVRGWCARTGRRHHYRREPYVRPTRWSVVPAITGSMSVVPAGPVARRAARAIRPAGVNLTRHGTRLPSLIAALPLQPHCPCSRAAMPLRTTERVFSMITKTFVPYRVPKSSRS